MSTTPVIATTVTCCSYREFVRELTRRLNADTVIKTHEFSVTTFEMHNFKWLEFCRTTSKKYFTAPLPETNEELFALLRAEVEASQSTPSQAAEFDDLARLLAMPLNSNGVQNFLTAFRDSRIKDEEEGYLTEVLAVLKREFTLDSSVETRLCSRTAAITYESRSHPGKITIVTFAKEYKRECATCKKWQTTVHKLHGCSACKIVYYCDKSCQRQDWRNHRITCLK